MEKIKDFYFEKKIDKKRKISNDLIIDSKKYLDESKKIKELTKRQKEGELLSEEDLFLLKKREARISKIKQDKAKEIKVLSEDNSKDNKKELKEKRELNRRDFIKLGITNFLGILGGKQLLKILDNEDKDNYQEKDKDKEIDKKNNKKLESQEQVQIKKSDQKIIGKTIEDQLKVSDHVVLNLETKNALWKKWKDSYSPRPENYSGNNSELGKNYLGLVESMERMQPWLKSIRREFQKVGIPEHFSYLAIPESHFKLKDYSIAQARGPYQFTKSSAGLFGLRVDNLIDERCDPIKSARACAEHLKYSYERFNNDWDLAFADYNGGFTNIYAKYRSKKDRNYEDYLEWREDRINEYIKRKNQTIYTIKKGDSLFGISKKFGISIEEIKEINKLESDKIKIGQKININKKSFNISDLNHSLENLNYPEKFYAILDVIKEQDLEKKYDESRSLSFKNIKVSKGNYFEKKYIVKKGDGSFNIARKFKNEIDKMNVNNLKISIIDILNLIKKQNKIKDVAKIYPGQEIKIKGKININASLKSIAEEYGCDLNNLLTINPAVINSENLLPNDYKIRLLKK